VKISREFQANYPNSNLKKSDLAIPNNHSTELVPRYHSGLDVIRYSNWCCYDSHAASSANID